jgi:hypothetical protein
MLVLIYGTISAGEIERYDYAGVPGGELKRLSYHVSWRYAMIFFVPVCFVWILAVVAMGEFVVSTAASVWFFSKER